MKITTILVATDLGPAARPLYDYAAALAQHLEARVVLTNVDESSIFDVPIGLEAARTTRMLHDLQRFREEELTDDRALFEDLDIPVTVCTASGSPADEICHQAHVNAAELLVIGRTGTRPVGRLGLGHTTKRVLRQVSIPTLVVPGPPRRQAEAEPLSAVPLRGGRFIAATAFTSTCLQSLDVTIELARHLAARVDCVHVIRLPVQPLRFAAADWPRIVPDETREELLHTHARDLGAFLGEARGSGCTPYTVIDASVARGLRDQAIETAADLITIPTHSGGREHPPRFGSTTENVIKLAPVPVLVFPVPFLERRWSVAAE